MYEHASGTSSTRAPQPGEESVRLSPNKEAGLAFWISSSPQPATFRPERHGSERQLEAVAVWLAASCREKATRGIQPPKFFRIAQINPPIIHSPKCLRSAGQLILAATRYNVPHHVLTFYGLRRLAFLRLSAVFLLLISGLLCHVSSWDTKFMPWHHDTQTYFGLLVYRSTTRSWTSTL
ncbi:uncharacterized protein MYCFIDRAFT_169235 [Pseudocercospora fijiensis CIRAD86]|uniref:Uncharacterized protein n=1 Tax=Pseudocercospora fijiensis (strain CIRAD86) TaxID=383855 RepID=N1Q916_PSEFD|nr:uncharacterized protein MYCFIDRAFT_169235 [Pseudocercospora fijiensis CIRAD86]EME87402.1 hypothetical protein MYCFIDRAFT_169235 [Pseudocercospora fijiensis CIRAD86]